MQALRKGKELYAELYPKAIEMNKNGVPIKDIAKQLGVSYSAVYAWLKQGRVPEEPEAVKMKNYLEKHGPTAAADIAVAFPKHNDFFHLAARRGIKIKRAVLEPRLKDYRTWYYLEGQESELEKRIAVLRKKYKEMKEKVLKSLGT